MCLIDNKRFRFTFKPIKVYKVLKYDNTTPFTNIKLSRKNLVLKGNPIHSTQGYVYEKGFIHSCSTREKAEALIESIAHREIRKVYCLNTILLQDKQTVEFFQNKYKIIEGYVIGRYAIGNNSDICGRILILNL